MSNAIHHDRLTEAQFFAWAERQEIRYELVDGQPVPKRYEWVDGRVVAMVGTTRRHDRVTGNVFAALHGRLRGSGCVVNTADTAVRIANRNIRYPDVSVDCGRFLEQDRAADALVLVLEVLSPSTAAFDQTIKLEEYRSVPSIRHVAIVDPERGRVLLHTRESEGWSFAVFDATAAAIPLPAIGIELPFAEMFDGVALRPMPRLVPTPQDDGLG